MGINIGALLAPIVCSFLALNKLAYGIWSRRCIGMLLGLVNTKQWSNLDGHGDALVYETPQEKKKLKNNNTKIVGGIVVVIFALFFKYLLLMLLLIKMVKIHYCLVAVLFLDNNSILWIKCMKKESRGN